jgi:hypothetical protein
MTALLFMIGFIVGGALTVLALWVAGYIGDSLAWALRTMRAHHATRRR